MAKELQIDQSVAHNGVCLTVVSLDEDRYTVTAIEETLQKTNLGDLQTGDAVNLERAMFFVLNLDLVILVVKLPSDLSMPLLWIESYRSI